MSTTVKITEVRTGDIMNDPNGALTITGVSGASGLVVLEVLDPSDGYAATWAFNPDEFATITR